MLNAGETKANLIIVFKFCCSHTHKKKKNWEKKEESKAKGKKGKKHTGIKRKTKKNPETY